MIRIFGYGIYISMIFLSLFISVQAIAQCPSNLDFEVTGSLCVDGTVTFTNISSSSDGGTFQFTADSKTLTTAPYSLTFSTPGTKNITLRRTDPSGCSNDFSKSIEITEVAMAEFSFGSDNNNPPCSNDPIQFTDESTPGNNLSYLWDFGNGNTSKDKNPTASLPAFGDGTADLDVTLTITTEGSCTSNITKQISVKERPIIALNDDFGFPIEAFKNCENATSNTPGFDITFLDKTSTAVTNYKVNWGDGTTDYNGTAPPSSHTYTDLGIFEITYNATGPNGCIASKKYNVVNISNPSVGGGNPGNSIGCSPLSLTFPITGFESNHSSTIYQIDPGDGSGLQTVNHPPPASFTHVYNTTSCGLPGNAFTFEIIATNGCKSTPFSTSAIEVYTPPVAEFELQNDTLCINQNATFINKTVAGFNSNCNSNTKYEWDFGDGNTQETLNNSPAMHQYTNAGEYNVVLTASNSCGTSATTNTIIICDAQPISLFTMDVDGASATSTPECGDNAVELILPDGICPPISLALNIDDNLETCDEKYSWKVISENDGYVFQNGQATSDNPNEIITFSNGGSYIIQQTVTNACGSVSSCIRVNLSSAPAQPKIEMDENFCEGDMIALQATLSGPADDFNWIVKGINGTADPSIAEDLSILEPNPFFLPIGTYDVSIEVFNDCGKSVDSKAIKVNGFPDAVISNKDSLSTCQGDIVLITANTGTAFSYEWQLDSMTIPDSNSSTYEATKLGIYTVEVTQYGCSKISNGIFLSFTKGPTPSIRTDDDILLCHGVPIDVDIKFDIEENVLYQWFKDGNPILGEMDSTYYTTEVGAYHVEATKSLCQVKSNTLEVKYLPEIVPNFDFSPKQCKGVEVDFTNTTPVPPGTNLVHSWDFGDGSHPGSGTNEIHIYDTVGIFDLTLSTSIDSNLCTSQVIRQIEIVEPIEAKFDMSISPGDQCGPLSVDFDNQSTGNYLTYNWDFGNGEQSLLENPSQINFMPGILSDTSYVVALQVMSDVGTCAGQILQDTLWVKPLPTSKFIFEKDEICADFPLQINNYSLGEPESFIWDFGDGTPTITTNLDGTINHAFPYTGFSDTTYLVTLTSINACGSDILTRSVTVTSINVEAFFNMDKNQGCAPLNVNFTSNQVGFNAITWDWGDQRGNTSSEGITQSHIYENAGTYDVKLMVQNGCHQDSFTQQITVSPSPEVDFMGDGRICVDQEVIFTNTSSQTTGSVWSFEGVGADSLFVGAIPPALSYNSGGNYKVALVVTDQITGCSNSKTKSIEVLPLPIADFIVNQHACPDVEVAIHNNSSNASNFNWRFQDGGAVVYGDESPAPVYTSPGIYTITMIAQNELACADSISRQINVQQAANPYFEMMVVSSNENDTPLEVAVDNLTQFPLYGNGIFEWSLPDGSQVEAYDIQGNLTLFNYSDIIQSQKITLTATTQYGCTASFDQFVDVAPVPCDERLKLPNVFTPNGDGLNDELRSLIRQNLDVYRPATANDILVDYRMEVYSRWGELIFRSENVEEGWKGEGHTEDVYLVVVSFQCKFNGGGKFSPEEVLLKH